MRTRKCFGMGVKGFKKVAMADSPPTALLIAGATASGKSALAVALAERLGGHVINADSMQVYDTLRVLTARPDASAEARAPHVLYGHVPAACPDYSTGRWCAEAHAAIAEAQGAGCLPILVGGTGLYFRALTEGLAEIPDIPAAVRDELRAEVAAPEALHARLADCDPILAARVHVNDRQRILRGLEVFAATGRPLSDWQGETSEPPLEGAAGILLLPDRAWLYARCDRRVEAMLEAGAEAEIDALAALDLPPSLPVMKALGVAELLELRAGKLAREEAIAAVKQETRRYAKRQMTWFRNQMIAYKVFSEQDYDKESANIFSYISNLGLTTP